MAFDILLRKWTATRRAVGLLACLVLGATVLGACGTDEETSPGPDYERELAGAPAQLAALHAEGNQLLDGGLSAFERRISRLKGFPAVVNVWASWCAPCRAEFPHFQEASASFGKEVAFLGVDSDDDADAAATFLETHPVPYPSYSDPDKKIATHLDATHGIPATAFFDGRGEQVFVKYGPYRDLAELEADIKRYASSGRSPE